MPRAWNGAGKGAADGALRPLHPAHGAVRNDAPQARQTVKRACTLIGDAWDQVRTGVERAVARRLGRKQVTAVARKLGDLLRNESPSHPPGRVSAPLRK